MSKFFLLAIAFLVTGVLMALVAQVFITDQRVKMLLIITGGFDLILATYFVARAFRPSK